MTEFRKFLLCHNTLVSQTETIKNIIILIIITTTILIYNVAAILYDIKILIKSVKI